MDEKKLKKEVTRKEDGRTLIYYTWVLESPGENQSNAKPICEEDAGVVEK